MDEAGRQSALYQAEGRIQRFEELSARKGPEYDGEVELGSVSSRLGRTTIELKHICKAYGDKVLIQDFSYIFLKNDRVGFIGQNAAESRL